MFGKRNAAQKASATGLPPAPMTPAIKTCRTKPKTRLAIVMPLTVASDFRRLPLMHVPSGEESYRGGFPPAQIITGTRDLLLSDATRLHMRLLDLGRESELRVYEGMWHAFADIPEEAQVYDAMTRFLRARLG